MIHEHAGKGRCHHSACPRKLGLQSSCCCNPTPKSQPRLCADDAALDAVKSKPCLQTSLLRHRNAPRVLATRREELAEGHTLLFWTTMISNTLLTCKVINFLSQQQDHCLLYLKINKWNLKSFSFLFFFFIFKEAKIRTKMLLLEG